MPTLRYRIDTICTNCWSPQEVSIPRGCQFQPYTPEKPGHISGYYKYQTGKLVRQSCSSCGCATLCMDPSTQMPEGFMQYLKLTGGAL